MDQDPGRTDRQSVAVTRVVSLPGIRLGESLTSWFAIPKNSDGHKEYAHRLQNVDDAECAAYQAAQSVIVR